MEPPQQLTLRLTQRLRGTNTIMGIGELINPRTGIQLNLSYALSHVSWVLSLGSAGAFYAAMIDEE